MKPASPRTPRLGGCLAVDMSVCWAGVCLTLRDRSSALNPLPDSPYGILICLFVFFTSDSPGMHSASRVLGASPGDY